MNHHQSVTETIIRTQGSSDTGAVINSLPVVHCSLTRTALAIGSTHAGETYIGIGPTRKRNTQNNHYIGQLLAAPYFNYKQHEPDQASY
jgi:hypothetical protein